LRINRESSAYFGPGIACYASMPLLCWPSLSRRGLARIGLRFRASGTV